MTKVRIDNSLGPVALPGASSAKGWGAALTENPVAGKQDRDLQRFHRKAGPKGTTEANLGSGHGLAPIRKFGAGA